MNSYYVEMAFELRPQQDREGFERHLDDVAEVLDETPGVDGDVGTDLDHGRVDLCMTLTADSRVDGLGVAAARTAIHAAGGRSPRWENLLSKCLDDEDYALTSTPSSWSVRTDCMA
jgi:hypothetical protein